MSRLGFPACAFSACAAFILTAGLSSAHASGMHHPRPAPLASPSARVVEMPSARPGLERRRPFRPVAAVYPGVAFGPAVSQTVVTREAPMPERITIVREPPAVAGIRAQPAAAPVIYVIRPPGWRPPQAAETPRRRGRAAAVAQAMPMMAADDSFLPRIVEVRPR